jgi:penicillin-binding protein 1B
MAAKKPRSTSGRSRSTPRSRARFSFVRLALSLTLVVGPPLVAATALAAWMEYAEIEKRLVETFDGRRWDFPSQIYSDSYAVYPGLAVSSDAFKRRLATLGYKPVPGRPARRGEYQLAGQEMKLWLHGFEYPDHREPGRLLEMRLDREGRVIRIAEADGGAEIYEFLLEPARIGGVHGASAEQRKAVGIDEIPVALVRAVLAVEDRRFFEHSGVDGRALARAMVVNLRSGEVRQGGSTLTQQLMKNFFLTDERTLSRKFREAVMAVAAEQRFSKLEILENYLNEIYLGQDGAFSIHGVWEASQFYFGVEPSDLTVAQIATLAAIIRAPNYYSPQRHPERARERRDLVLGMMHAQGDIDAGTYERALAEPVVAEAPGRGEVDAPYFLDHVRRDLLGRYPKDVLSREGYRIFTTLDPELQEIAERVVRENVAEIEADHAEVVAKVGQPLQAALIAMNPRTGAVVAMVGGRDYRTSQFNRVTDMRRQPGSTFKPIVMCAALGSEQVGAAHFRPTDKVMDERMRWEYGGEVWSPRNYEEKFYGLVSVRDVLEHSLNSATARISKDIGIRPIRDLAVRLGMDPKLQAFPAIVLGGWPVPPFDMAQVFSVFAAGGVRANPLAVRKVVDRDNRAIDGRTVEISRVIPATDAYMVTHLLAGVMERGTGAAARRKGFRHPAAGKTGTSNDYKDAWFVGFTPDLLAVVWVGFDQAASLGLAGSEAALPIWTDFMRQALADHPHTSFQIPEGITLVDVDKETGGLATPSCNKVVREAFLAGEGPHPYSPDHARF